MSGLYTFVAPFLSRLQPVAHKSAIDPSLFSNSAVSIAQVAGTALSATATKAEGYTQTTCILSAGAIFIVTAFTALRTVFGKDKNTKKLLMTTVEGGAKEESEEKNLEKGMGKDIDEDDNDGEEEEEEEETSNHSASEVVAASGAQGSKSMSSQSDIDSSCQYYQDSSYSYSDYNMDPFQCDLALEALRSGELITDFISCDEDDCHRLVSNSLRPYKQFDVVMAEDFDCPALAYDRDLLRSGGGGAK